MTIRDIRRKRHGHARYEWHALRIGTPRPLEMCKTLIHGQAEFQNIDVAELDCEECRAAVAAYALAQPERVEINRDEWGQDMIDALRTPYWANKAK